MNEYLNNIRRSPLFAFKQSHIAYKALLFATFKLLFLPPWSNGIDVFVYTKKSTKSEYEFCYKPNTSLQITLLNLKVFRFEIDLNKHMRLETTRKTKLGNENMGFRGIFKMTMKKAIL